MLTQDRSKRNVIKTGKGHNGVWKAREETVKDCLFKRMQMGRQDWVWVKIVLLTKTDWHGL